MVEFSHLSLIAALCLSFMPSVVLADEDHVPTYSQITLLDAVKKAEAEGYHDFYKVEFEKNKYEIKALDKSGKKIELKIDANTGTISEGHED